MKRLLSFSIFMLLAIAGFAQGVSEENPVDKTSLITNPSFENSTNGWTCENLGSQSNSSFTKKSGSYYIEKWTSQGNTVGDAMVKQTLKNVPIGKYKMTVAAQNLSQANTTRKNTGAYIYAGDQKEPVYTPADYSVIFTNIIGEVEIGFVAQNATGNWLAVDNFRLYQIGEITAEEVVAELNRIIAIADSVKNNMMSAATASALQQAITEAKAITMSSSEADIQTAGKALLTAIDNASVSIAEYKALTDKITETEKSYDESKQGATDFKAELDKAKALAANADATSEELAQQIADLDRARLAFCLANATPGSGTAPKVTVTHHYVATGATQALMRATMVGSNILERGVCWSTEHNPTVLDNKSTKYFDLKGYLFHIKGLTPCTVYYLRPYVMNKTYTVAYGDEVKIVTHPQGTCRGTWDEGAPDEAANARCRNAIQQTINYFNEWTGIKGFTLSGHYGAQTPTADCSYGGWMRIGPNAGNQAIGTVLHETGHGVGVGTHWRWSDCADTRENTTHGLWLGREANTVLRFLENCDSKKVAFTGDGVHGWGTIDNRVTATAPNASITFDWLVNGSDKDKHKEEQYIGGMCILYGLFIDGLCPTGSDPNGISGYTYNFDDAKKYYLMNKHTDRGLGTGLLFQSTKGYAVWRHILEEETVNDSAAWYMEYDAKNSRYMFKNAATGQYLTRSGNYMKTKKVTSSISSSERFQLMPDRVDVTIGSEENSITTHGYWFTWNDGENKAMSASAFTSIFGYGQASVAAFSFKNTATAQQWIIISEDELEAFKNALIATSIQDVNRHNDTMNQEMKGIYNTDGRQLQQMRKGLNIVRYQNGDTRKVIVK